MQKTKTKTELLDSLFQHISEDDWQDGLAIYQSGKVKSASEFNGLITGTATDFDKTHEVRIKIHPAGHCVQWIECTCRKNRVSGRYCEHIAALMLHIDREQSNLISRLDAAMPLKPPTPQRQKAGGEKQKVAEESKKSNAKEMILDQLKGSIESVTLMTASPSLRVKLEIKEGQLTHYDLGIDDSASFLATRPKVRSVAPEVKALKIFETGAELGFYVHSISEEQVVVERVVALAVDKNTKQPMLPEKLNSVIAKCQLNCRIRGSEKARLYELVNLKTSNKYLGQKFFFGPPRGFWPLVRDFVTPEWWDTQLKKVVSEDAAVDLLKDGMNSLLDAGPVFLDANIDLPNIVSIPQLEDIHVNEHTGGWFKLDPRYGKGKSSISMASLLKAYRSNKRKYYKSGDSWIEIPDFVKEVDWKIEDDGESVVVDAIGMMRLKAMVGDFDRFVGSKTALIQLKANLEPGHTTELPTLEHTKLNLRNYQQEGFQWLWWLYSNGFHGLLADEMGLGKTHQTMAMLSAIQKTEPKSMFLVICPTTVLDHWEDKLRDFCPNLNAQKYHGPKRLQELAILSTSGRTVITSYGVILRDIKYFEKVEWGAIVLDEAHAIKNNETGTYSAVCRLKTKIRVCLTGTPMENHLLELKSIYDFLLPGFLGSDAYFKKNFLRPIEQDRDVQTEVTLQRLIHPFKLRRTKNLVLTDLPEKIEDIRHVSLTEEQVNIYREIIDARARPITDQLKNEESPIPFLHVFAILTMLKQICDHPSLVLGGSDWRKHTSGKFELLKELLEEAAGSGHKVVIYSQYVAMIEIIHQYLTSIEMDHVVLTGQTRDRGQVIKRFQNDEKCRVFVGSLLAGGIGIDLTAASIVIHYDRWWNASKENQATDRVHRIGQVRNVQVLKLICRGTLEEKIDAMIKTKANLFERFMDKDEEIFKNLSRQELIELLA